MRNNKLLAAIFINIGQKHNIKISVRYGSWSFIKSRNRCVTVSVTLASKYCLPKLLLFEYTVYKISTRTCLCVIKAGVSHEATKLVEPSTGYNAQTTISMKRNVSLLWQVLKTMNSLCLLYIKCVRRKFPNALNVCV